MALTFTRSFTLQEPIPEAGIARATEIMSTGRLHRYDSGPGEMSEASLLEAEFADYLGVPYCLAVASGGAALATALRATGVRPGDVALTNAFTLAPVPGAIAAVGARPAFVETTEALIPDLDDLEQRAEATGARHLVLSHMRGHQPDMDVTMARARALGLTVIEDCAHTMGATANGLPSGRHGDVACFSTQTYKHINSGEGGLLTTEDAEIAARAVLLSGSYMLYERHGAVPDAQVFEAVRDTTPNVSGRMDNLRAAILRPQLSLLADRVRRWRALHDTLTAGLRDVDGLALVPPQPGVERVGSSFQMLLPDWAPRAVEALVHSAAKRGVVLKWFGAPRAQGYTSRYDHWRYAGSDRLPRTDQVLGGLIDMRLPLTFSTDDADLIGAILRDEVAALAQTARAG